MTGGLPGDPGQQAHASRSLTSALTAAESDPQGQVPAPGCKTGSDPTNLPASQAARHHPTHPQARTDPKRRTTDGLTPASSPPARAEDFTRTRPAPMSTAVKSWLSLRWFDPTPATSY